MKTVSCEATFYREMYCVFYTKKEPVLPIAKFSISCTIQEHDNYAAIY